MMYSFSYLETVCCSMSSSICCFLICIQISQETSQLFWYFHLFQNFSVCCVHTVKGFGIVNKARVDVFLKLFCFFDNPTDIGNLISGSSGFSNSSLNIWKFMGHVLLKPGVENYECNGAVVRHSLTLPFFGSGMKTYLFQSCVPC